MRDILVFPNLLLSLQPDYLLVYLLTPLGPARTRVAASIHFAPASFVGGACHAPDVFAFWDLTNGEDRRICEGQQLGVASAGYRAGRYTRVDDGLYAFDQWLLGAYGL